MIIVKTPFRISFVGGGSDLAEFYTRGYGAVVSTAIDKFMYIMIHPYFHDKIRIKYSRTEDVTSVSQIRHPLVRECLALTKIEKGIEIASIADVPAGTGLGSSSAFTVGLLNALSRHKSIKRSKAWLARAACAIEIEKAGSPIGKQDQYAAAFGGVNYIRFNADHSVDVQPLRLDRGVIKRLQESLLLFYVGNERKASAILRRQKVSMRRPVIHTRVAALVKLAEKMKSLLTKGSVEEFGSLLHEGWLLKKTLTGGITDPGLDALYEKALRAGATGGKLLGAGAGGFFLLHCPVRHQHRLRGALKLRELKFKFYGTGSQIVYSDRRGAGHDQR